MPEKNELQAALDSHISKGITQANAEFKQHAGTSRAVVVGAYTMLRGLIRRERGQYAQATTSQELEPFCVFLGGVVDRFDLGNDDFTRAIKDIINKQKESFDKFLRKLPEDKKARNGDSSFEITYPVYELAINHVVQQWLTHLPSNFFQNIPFFFLGKDKFTTHVKYLTRKLEDLASEVTLLLFEAFPFEGGEIKLTKNAFNAITEEVLHSISLGITEMWNQLGLDNADLRSIPILNELESKIAYDRILATAKGKRIESEEFAQLAEEVDSWKSDMEGNVSEALLGQERYEYALQRMKEPFLAFPDEEPPHNLLYPIEFEMLKRWVNNLINERKLNSNAEIKKFIAGEEGEILLVDLTDILNNKLHAGFQIREAERDRNALLEVVGAYIDQHYPSTEVQSPDFIVETGYIDNIPGLREVIDETSVEPSSEPEPPAESIIDTASPSELSLELSSRSATHIEPVRETESLTPSMDDATSLVKPVRETESLTPSMDDATSLVEPVRETRPASIRPAVNFGAEISLDTLPSLGHLPGDLTLEERPEHIPEAIFVRINEILRWARNADKSGSASRSIHRLIIAKTALITSHLQALSLNQTLILLVELEGLRSLLGDNITVRGKAVKFEQWVEVFARSLDHLDASNAEKNLGDDIVGALKTLRSKIIELEKDLAGVETLRKRATKLTDVIASITEKIKTVESRETEMKNHHSALTQEFMGGVTPGTPRFAEIIRQFTDIQEKAIKYKTQKDELQKEKSTLEEEATRINGQLMQADEKNKILEKFKAAQSNAFETIKNITRDIEHLIENS